MRDSGDWPRARFHYSSDHKRFQIVARIESKRTPLAGWFRGRIRLFCETDASISSTGDSEEMNLIRAVAQCRQHGPP